MASLQFALTLLAGVLLGCVVGSPERPPLTDPGRARELFRLAEGKRNQSDGHLTMPEVTEIFKVFDSNGDNQIQQAEFVNEWTHLGLGGVMNAMNLFQRADTDKDGVLSDSPDLERVFNYFDLDGNHFVTEMEFVVAWATMSN